jgi:hypothetical protein
LSDAQVHPRYLGKTVMTVLTFPIRVGDIPAAGASAGGCSGPFPNDSTEISWGDLGVAAEFTTITTSAG